MREEKIVYKSITELKEYNNNPRYNKEAIGPVAESIREFGIKVPLVIASDNTIVCGHTRLKACELLGIKEVPCIIADDLTSDKIKAFRLADNKVAEIAKWDFEKLEQELLNIEIDMSQFNFEQVYVNDSGDDEPEEPKEQKLKEPKLHTCPECGCEFED